ncbi:MAG TPA: NAD-binding protein, partial [Methanocorpusculum sp.]|nr:NAD-binding protein [Methanocorpusculum sp.]
AFLAGVAIAGSDYNHEVIGQVSPIRDILASFFFVSLGVMLKLNDIVANILLIFGIVFLLMAGKTVINFFSVKTLGVATGTCILSAVGLSQIGEFSFILGKEGLNAGILNEELYNSFLAISIITMAITPFIVDWIPKFVNKHSTSQLPKEGNVMETDERHEIIVGFGLTGHYVAQALKKLNIPYIIIEMNAQTVKMEKKNGENIIYGDASRDAILEYAGIMKAQSIVISIPQMDAVKAIITTARRLNPQITIITRSRFISETSGLYRLGADEVIVDERESAVQIFKRILATKQLPVQDIDALSRDLRSKLYNKYIEAPKVFADSSSNVPKLIGSLKKHTLNANRKISSEMSKIEEKRIEPGSYLCNKKLSEVHLRRNYGISVLAIRHIGETDVTVSPDGEVCLRAGDTVVLIGHQKSLSQIAALFNAETKH